MLFEHFYKNKASHHEQKQLNRPFPSSLVPLFQSESKCETFHMKMSSACRFIFLQIKVIFMRMVSHLDSLWNRGTRELGNGLFLFLCCTICTICLHHSRFCIVDCRMGIFESFHWCYMRKVQTTWHPHKTACSVALNSFDNVTCLFGFPQSFMQIEPKRQNIWILCELFRHLFV